MSNWLHVVIFLDFFISLRHIPYIPFKRIVVSLRSWASTGSFVTTLNIIFSVSVCSPHSLLYVSHLSNWRRDTNMKRALGSFHKLIMKIRPNRTYPDIKQTNISSQICIHSNASTTSLQLKIRWRNLKCLAIWKCHHNRGWIGHWKLALDYHWNNKNRNHSSRFDSCWKLISQHVSRVYQRKIVTLSSFRDITPKLAYCIKSI